MRQISESLDRAEASGAAQRKVDPRFSEAIKPATLSIVVPTFNERENVRELVTRLDRCLAGINWEAVFVDDDSADETIGILRAIARSDGRVRLLHRIGRRGLSSAVVEGILSTNAPFVAVMDCDLQHDESLLPRMYNQLRGSNYDVVVASRYLADGGVRDWEKSRRRISGIANNLARAILREKLTDPMSGFFVIKRQAFDGAVRQLSKRGYKILLDILLSARPRLKVMEMPYRFRNRVYGESKLDFGVAWDYLTLLLDKSAGRIVPVNFIMFSAVGAVGLAVHMLVLASANRAVGLSFVTSQFLATIVAMTFNFFLNNLLTYRDKRLYGLWPVVAGLLSFYISCGIGAIANVGVGSALFAFGYPWWLSGMVGVLVGGVWNYATTSVFTWRR